MILFVVAGLLAMWDQTAFMRGDATLKKLEANAKELKSKLPEKVDDITTLVDLQFEPTEMTQWYVVDLSKYCCKPFPQPARCLGVRRDDGRVKAAAIIVLSETLLRAAGDEA